MIIRTSSAAIALSLIAAEALVCACLNGRTIPEDLHSVLISQVRTRLIDGNFPVLNQEMCSAIEDVALECGLDSLESK